MDARASWISWLLAAALAAAAADGLAQSGEVYRWINDAGEVIFSPTLPPEAAGKPYEVLRNGIVVRRVLEPETAARPAPEVEKKDELVPIYSPEQKRQMEDRLLMLKYKSEEEIVEQMEIELDHLKYDFRLLENTAASLSKSLDQLITSAANRQRAGLEIEADQRGQIEGLRQRMARNESELEKLRERSQVIRDRFQREIDRYRELTSPEQAG